MLRVVSALKGVSLLLRGPGSSNSTLQGRLDIELEADVHIVHIAHVHRLRLLVHRLVGHHRPIAAALRLRVGIRIHIPSGVIAQHIEPKAHVVVGDHVEVRVLAVVDGVAPVDELVLLLDQIEPSFLLQPLESARLRPA